MKNIVIQKKINVLRLFKKYNLDDDGTLNLNEFSKLIKKVDPGLTNKEIEYAFRYFDSDGGAEISQQEFIKVIYSLILLIIY